ncbi:MAG: nicotinate (nicotinamide) nucleotide adenylyltransferase [Cyanobacteria bacterium REEB65]|nr:nicotinate (nicotinamide) nucleotide adenylyltransferase [Cyanobacteria bacterium REEB65]
MNIAILGGSFDPVHVGHVAIAQAALASGMDRIVWMPAAASPFKRDRPPAPVLDRWSMVLLATQAEERFRVSRLEFDRPPPSYSIETVWALEAEVKAEFGELGVLWWILGADHVPELPRWHRIHELAQRVRFLIVPRADLSGNVLRAECERMQAALGADLVVLEMPLVGVSSTEIRRKVASGESIVHLVPLAVAAYIQRYGLYRGPQEEASAVDYRRAEDRLCDYLEREMPPKRRSHVYGVASTAQELAVRFGADADKARLAALAHDLVRLWPPEKLVSACRERSLPLAPFDLSYPLPRLHGLLAAHLLGEWFGVWDPEIQAAIASHTIGRPGMSLLERVVYVADSCEPGRGPQAEGVRAAARTDLDAAVGLAMDEAIAYLLARRLPIHPYAIEARNALLALARTASAEAPEVSG